MRSLLLALAVLVGGCAEPSPPTPTTTVTVRAVFLRSLYDGDAVLVRHEVIGDWMPAMEMPLSVYTPALLDGLREGAKVRLTLDSASLRVVDVESLPFETVLNLDSGDGDGGGIVLPTLDE